MLRRKRKASDFSAEIEAHLEHETARLLEQGLSEQEARAAARRSFGNVMKVEERFYESGRWFCGIISGRIFASACECWHGTPDSLLRWFLPSRFRSARTQRSSR